MKLLDNIITKAIAPLSNSLGSLQTQFRAQLEINSRYATRISDLEQRLLSKDIELLKLQTTVESRLNDFYREFLDKYFNSLSSIFQWNREMSILTRLTGDDTEKLKKELMKPFLEQKWVATKVELASKLEKSKNTIGGKLLQDLEDSREAMLKAQREERTDDYYFLKGRVDTLEGLLK